MSFLIRSAFIATAFLAGSSTYALEAVVQSDVGSGSAVAGSIGAVNARADALQGNVNAANILINQLLQKISTLEKQVSNTEAILDKIVAVNGKDGLAGVGGLNGYNGKDGVDLKSSSASGNWCGMLRWNPTSSGRDGEYLIQPIWRPYNGGGWLYLYMQVYAHAPCNGESIIVDHKTHCPSGYTFTVVGEDHVGSYLADNYGAESQHNPLSGNYDSTGTLQGTCLKN